MRLHFMTNFYSLTAPVIILVILGHAVSRVCPFSMIFKLFVFLGPLQNICFSELFFSDVRVLVGVSSEEHE